MRYWKLALVCLIVGLPTLGHGEIVVLKDGSNFKGTLLRFVEDTLYFKTSFGAEIRIARAKVVRIEFSDSLLAPGVIQLGRPVPVRPVVAVPGTLSVEFQNVEVSSTISVHRDKDREGHEKANTIDVVIIVDGRTVYQASDSTMDKIIKKGAEVLVRNKMKPVGVKVGLKPGMHQVTVVLANSRAGKYRDRLLNGGVDKRVTENNVLILAGETRHFMVGLKRRKLGLTRSVLYVIP